MKKNNLITLILITISCNTNTMEPEQSNKNWLTLVTDSLLYDIKPLEYLFFQDRGFENLPNEEQAEAIQFLTQNNNASTLEAAANAINSLTKVNKQLDTLINNPQICLKLIKHLTYRFDCSNETVANALQTKEANNRLFVQKKFEKLFSTSDYSATLTYTEKGEKKTVTMKTLYDFSIKKFKKLYEQYKNYIDLDFTYRNFQSSQYDDKDTLLINSATYPSPYKTVKIASLLDKVDINYQNAQYETALMKCAANCDNPAALKLLCDAPKIQIDLVDENSNTALIRVCLMKQKRHKTICISLLLRAGADPEKINSYGQTPLSILKSMGDNEKEIELIEGAINKKNAPLVQEMRPYFAQGFEGQAKKSTTTNKRLNKK